MIKAASKNSAQKGSPHMIPRTNRPLCSSGIDEKVVTRLLHRLTDNELMHLSSLLVKESSIRLKKASRLPEDQMPGLREVTIDEGSN